MYHVNGQTVIDFGATEPVSTVSHEKVGLSFDRADGQRVILATLSSFGFVWRGHYETWDVFLEEAEQAWFRYKDATEVAFVEHVGVRFVNHIPIPNPSIEIQDYLRTTIHLAPQLPQLVTNLYAQVTIPFVETGCDVTITTGVLTDEEALLLDIDAQSNLHAYAADKEFDAQLRDRLSSLRQTKNFAFEACITDATRSLIN